MNEKIEKFLAALTELSKEHGIWIHDRSCGCCGYTSLEESYDPCTNTNYDDKYFSLLDGVYLYEH